MNFFLGTHHVDHLGKTSVPLFVSARRLRPRKSFPRALGPWSLDSGGFSEISLHGRWMTSPEQYADEVLRWRHEIGRMEWAATQDWMCEPWMLKRTGLDVAEHQRRSTQSYLTLRRLAPLVPWLPVLQGFEVEDYVAHLRLYADAGVDLRQAPAVGVGSVCRRQHTEEVAGVFRRLFGLTGLRLHGFGVKVRGLVNAAPWLASADSLAWSFRARREDPLPGHEKWHKNCANCLEYALMWRAETLQKVQAEHGTDIGYLARILA